MKLKIILLIVFLSITLLIPAQTNHEVSIDRSTQIFNNLNKQEQDYETILDYKDVLKGYYDIATNNITSPSKTFGEFYDSYYAECSDRNLYKFTLELAEENNNYDYVYSLLEDSIELTSSGSNDLGGGKNGTDASYILKNSNSNPEKTPGSYFARPTSNSYVFDYSTLSDGDVIVETENGDIDIGHAALIVETKHDSDRGNYVQTIEAVGGGVQYGFLDDYRVTRYECIFYRPVGRTREQINDAIYFAEKQLNKKYSLFTTDKRVNTSINLTERYCSELVYASWKYAGIDIGVRKDGDKDYHPAPIIPFDFAYSYNLIRTGISRMRFVSLDVVKKEGNDWHISIKNTYLSTVTVYYNSKMCYLSDARNWTGLEDVETIVLGPLEEKTVKIATNWFATAITACFASSSFRYITYADNLNTNGTLKEYINVSKIPA